MVGSIASSVLGGALQAGSAIYGTIASANADKQRQSELDAQRRSNRQWYEKKMNEDYTMRSDVQNLLRKQRDMLDEQYRRARATNIVAGGTDESLALQQQAANQAMGETLSNVAATAVNAKDAAEQQYLAQENALSQQQQQVYANKANAIAQAAGQGAQMGGNMLASGLENLTNIKKVNG